MRQGTTPKHTFTLPFSVPGNSVVRVIYAQNGEIVLVKTGSDVDVLVNEVSTTLTQEETLSFDSNAQNTEIQIRILMPDGSAVASDIIRVSVKKCLEDKVIAYEEGAV